MNRTCGSPTSGCTSARFYGAFQPSPDKRTTHIIGKQFDRILASDALTRDTPGRKDLVFVTCQRRASLADGNVSDHYPLVATFEVR